MCPEDRQFICLAGAKGMWWSGGGQCQFREGIEGSAEEFRLYFQSSRSSQGLLVRWIRTVFEAEQFIHSI